MLDEGVGRVEVERPMREKKSVCLDTGVGWNWGGTGGFRILWAGGRGAAGRRPVKGEWIRGVTVGGAVGRRNEGITGVGGWIWWFRLGCLWGGGWITGSQSIESAASSCGSGVGCVRGSVLPGDVRWPCGPRLNIEKGLRSEIFGFVIR